MAGIFARSQAIARSRMEPPVADNYATYRRRIEDAQASMRGKREQNQRRAQFLSDSFANEEAGMIEWGKRVIAIETTLDCYDGDTKGYEALAHLLETAKSMRSVFTNRVSTIQSSIDSLKQQEAPLINHINQLTAAKAKLSSAQSLEHARGTMDRILTSTSSLGVPSATNGDDQEIRSIRRLIAESEALAELKG
jgi:phage shock protein A